MTADLARLTRAIEEVTDTDGRADLRSKIESLKQDIVAALKKRGHYDLLDEKSGRSYRITATGAVGSETQE